MRRKQKPGTSPLFLRLLFWGALLCLSAPIQAFPLNFTQNTPEKVAQFHCRLLLYQTQDTDYMPEDKLFEIMGKDAYRHGMSPENLLAMNQLIGIAPEMDFIIGTRWQTLTREQRRSFNRLFSRQLIAQHRVQGIKSYDKACPMQVSLQESGKDAIATTHIATADGPLAVSYVLTRKPPGRWVMGDMLLNAESISGLYRKDYNQILAREGTAGLLSHMQDAVAKPE